MAEKAKKMLMLGLGVPEEGTRLSDIVKHIKPEGKIGLAATPTYLEKALKAIELEKKWYSGKLNESEKGELSRYFKEINADFRTIVKEILSVKAKPVALHDEEIVKQINKLGELMRLGKNTNYDLVDKKLVEELKPEFTDKYFEASRRLLENAKKNKVDVAIMPARHLKDIRKIAGKDPSIEFKKV
ncbi:hypothetical protein H0N96_02905 [Candidatus Micrarchaeota archaeon]|nr:hypothetical protein [Candidatus Micrarchaeota archaeon]